MMGLFIVADPPEVRCGEESLHHLIQGREPKTNCFVSDRRNGDGWGLGRREPPFADMVAKSWVGRVFNGTVYIGGRDTTFVDGDQVSVKWMVGQHHELLWGNVC
jgi:hypothetical protein